MELSKKLAILTGAAKYDVACTSSGVTRGGKSGMTGNTVAAGICHSFAADGRCISLLKILLTNYCIYDCQYCINRRSNDVERAAFTPREVAELTMNFYKRNYIEGLFLSSAVVKNPDHTAELIYESVRLVRKEYKFNGYIHVKVIPGTSPELLAATGFLADRMSVNIELPSSDSLRLLAPDKTKESILKPMGLLKHSIKQSKNELTLYRHAPQFVPGGQSTQMIVGATGESDKKIVTLAEGLYNNYTLKRVFYSAFIPVPSNNNLLPAMKTPLLREHRLYQADWLLRYYGFKADEILDDINPNLDLNMDPKCNWAIRNLHLFPIEVNKADYSMLLKVPGIGVNSARKIVLARRFGRLNFDNLKKMSIVLKRAKYFITCDGKMYESTYLSQEFLEAKLSENKIDLKHDQLSVYDIEAPTVLENPSKEDAVKCLTGEL